MLVKTYRRTVTNPATGYAYAEETPFTEAQATQVGAYWDSNGIPVAKAQELIAYWNRLGGRGDYIYEFSIKN